MPHRHIPDAGQAGLMRPEREDPRPSDVPDAGAPARALLPPSAMRTRLAAALALLIAASGIPARAESDEELAEQQDRVERHLLRVQQERFEARARGEDPKSLRRLDREFKRTYGRRNAIIDERKNAE